MMTDSPPLEDVANASPDLDYKHMYFDFEAMDNRTAFAQKLSRYLDWFARVGVPIVHFSTTFTKSPDGMTMRAAQIVVRMPLKVLDSTEHAGSAASTYESDLEIVDKLMGFKTPLKNWSDI
jgi:hypothetical protein